jgi:SAM-dependent methyltransferase
VSDAYVDSLNVTACLREPPLRQLVQNLDLRPGSCGLDVGSGTGLGTILLAQAIGSDGHVTGLDLDPEFGVHARQRAARVGLSERVSFCEGDAAHLPFRNATFDWAFSSDCVGYGPWDTSAMLAELARVVRPRGCVGLAFWSSETLLPGHPVLEAHLRSTRAGIAPFRDGAKPSTHPLRLLGALRDAGFVECTVHAAVGTVGAPLSPEVRRALLALFEMRWPGAEAELGEADRIEFRRLCRPDSAECALDSPDYCALFTLSLFRGVVPDPPPAESRQPLGRPE